MSLSNDKNKRLYKCNKLAVQHKFRKGKMIRRCFSFFMSRKKVKIKIKRLILRPCPKVCQDRMSPEVSQLTSVVYHVSSQMSLQTSPYRCLSDQTKDSVQRKPVGSLVTSPLPLWTVRKIVITTRMPQLAELVDLKLLVTAGLAPLSVPPDHRPLSPWSRHAAKLGLPMM